MNLSRFVLSGLDLRPCGARSPVFVGLWTGATPYVVLGVQQVNYC